MNGTYIIIIVLCVLIYVLCINERTVEHIAPVNWKGVNWFDYHHLYSPIVTPSDTWLARNHMLPWWNSTRHTRNSSWDIRGDVRPKGYYISPVGPWHNTPHAYNSDLTRYL